MISVREENAYADVKSAYVTLYLYMHFIYCICSINQIYARHMQ